MNTDADPIGAARRDLFLPLAPGYFALLVLIFLCGWLRPTIGGPATLFLALAAARIVQSDKFSWQRPLGLLLVVCLLIGAINPVLRPLKNLASNSPDYAYANITQSLGWHHLTDMTDPRFDLAAQYQGRGDSLAVHWLLKKNSTPATP